MPFTLANVKEHRLASKWKVLNLNSGKESFRCVSVIMLARRKILLIQPHYEMSGILLDSNQFEMLKYLRGQNNFR